MKHGKTEPVYPAGRMETFKSQKHGTLEVYDGKRFSTAGSDNVSISKLPAFLKRLK